MQRFIFNLNTTSRWGSQTPFSNLSFDLQCPKFMKNEACIIGGKLQDTCYGDYQKEMDMINKAFMTIMSKGDYGQHIFSFPIPTYNITEDIDWDTENAQLLLEMTAKYGTPYFQNFINSDINPEDVRSLCPIHPDEKVMIKSSRGISIHRIGNIYESSFKSNNQYPYQVLFNGDWVNAKINKIPADRMFKITLNNGTTIRLDEKHLQPCRKLNEHADRTVQVKDLEIGDYLPFSLTSPVDEEWIDGSDVGFFIGAFIGGGSYDEGSLIFSLNKTTKLRVADRLAQIAHRLGYTVTTSFDSDKQLYSLRVHSRGKSAYYWMRQFVGGEDAHTKTILSRVYDIHSSVLKGILEGWYATDGGNVGRIYTVSKYLKEDFQHLCGYLGIAYNVANSDTRSGRYGDSEVFTLKFHSADSYRPYFFKANNANYVRIDDIEEIDYKGKWVYCFEVDDDSHLFQMANGIITHNCRLRLDVKHIPKKVGGIFGAGDKTGSVQVTTLNLSRAAYCAEDEQEYFNTLDRLTDLCKGIQEAKRKVINHWYDIGLYPWTKRYLEDVGFKNHFSTIGVIGGHEACMNMFGEGIDSPKGIEFMQKTLKFIIEKAERYTEETGNRYNIEATPGEGTMYRLAKIDQEMFGEKIYISGTPDTPYYTGSTLLPMDATNNVFAALKHQDKLQPMYTGGTVFHTYVGEKIEDTGALKDYILKAFTLTKIPYLSITPVFSICPEHGYIVGAHEQCPTCGDECEVYERVVGFYRPRSRCNPGKKLELEQGKKYDWAVATDKQKMKV